MSRAAAMIALLLVLGAASLAAPAHAGTPPDVTVDATVVYDGDPAGEPLPGSVFQFTPLVPADDALPSTAGITDGLGQGTVTLAPGDYAVSAVGPKRLNGDLLDACEWQTTFVTGAVTDDDAGAFVVSVHAEPGDPPLAVTIGIVDVPRDAAAASRACVSPPVQAPSAGLAEVPLAGSLPDTGGAAASAARVDDLWVGAAAGSAALVAALIVALAVAARRRT
jgi:hypothetical protein